MREAYATASPGAFGKKMTAPATPNSKKTKSPTAMTSSYSQKALNTGKTF